MKNILILCILFFGSTISHDLHASDLVQSLMNELGVSEDQAQSGAGVLFSWAQDALSDEDFDIVRNAVPDMQSFLEATPEVETNDMFGDTGVYTGLSKAVKLFEQLGMNSKMLMKFKPIVLDYLMEKGGQAAYNLMSEVLAQ